MKKNIEFTPFDTIQKTSALVNDEKFKAQQIKNQKASSKIIKGKVKSYKKSIKPKFINNAVNLDEESELILISERMLLVLKLTFLFLIISTLFILIK